MFLFSKYGVQVSHTLTCGYILSIAHQAPYQGRMLYAKDYYPVVDRLVMKTVSDYPERNGILGGYTQEKKALINTFLCSTALSMYRRWEDDGRTLSSERMLELTGTLILGGLDGLELRRPEASKGTDDRANR